MDVGMRAEIRVTDPPKCQVSGVSEDASSVRAISRSATPVDDTVTEDVTVEGDADPEGMEEVFAHESERVYRFSREQGQGCVCELVETHGTPVQNVRADDGTLTLTFYAPNLDTLRDIVTDLREAFDGVSLHRLTRSERPNTEKRLVFVDRNALTKRQREVLETAHEKGYFSHPKEANATEVAEELDINHSTFAEHLAAAQSSIFGAVLDR